MTSIIEIEVEVDYIFEKGSPGRYNGRMEDSEPPEPDSARILTVKFKDSDMMPHLTTKQIEELQEEAVIEANEPKDY
jgi:hypothetical protein